jgi:magnesium transporter
METQNEQSSTQLLDSIVHNLETGQEEVLRGALEEVHPAEAANLLESLPPEQRSALWEAVPPEQEAEILTHLRDQARSSIIEGMDHAELVAAAESMEAEDLAEVLEEIPDRLTESILLAMDHDHRQRLEAVLSYEAGTAGRMMSADVVSVRRDVNLAVVLRWLRRHQRLPPHTDALMVISEDGFYEGKLAIADVVTGDPEALVEDVMQTSADALLASATSKEAAILFERRDLISVAVLDDDGQLLGRITVDDVVDLIREQADHTLLKHAGLEEDADLFAPVVPSARRRGVWLGINLLTVFLAAWVIGRFEEALDKIVALAVLMPVVASMGGIAGSQTLTLTIRGLALDQIARSNVRWLTLKEVTVGILNGMVWALVVALVSFLWFSDPGLAAIIAAAMVLNLLAAALSGVTIPLVLNKMGMDPALSGAVILTTVTDVVGFLSFLGLATMFLL